LEGNFLEYVHSEDEELGNLLENAHLEYQENGRITLIRISWRCAVRMAMILIRTVFNGNFSINDDVPSGSASIVLGILLGRSTMLEWI
jgi:hypothetical protein